MHFTSKNKITAPAMVEPIADISRLENTAGKAKNSKQLDFLYSFKPNYYFLRAVGLWPFSIVRDSNGDFWKPKVTKLDLIWFIIPILLYVSTSIIFFKCSTIFERNYLASTATYIFINGTYVRVELSLFFIASIIGIDMYNRFKIVNTLKMFADFDELVMDIDIYFYSVLYSNILI